VHLRMRRPGRRHSNRRARPRWRLLVGFVPVVVGIPHVVYVLVRDPPGMAEAVVDLRRSESGVFRS